MLLYSGPPAARYDGACVSPYFSNPAFPLSSSGTVIRATSADESGLTSCLEQIGYRAHQVLLASFSTCSPHLGLPRNPEQEWSGRHSQTTASCSHSVGFLMFLTCCPYGILASTIWTSLADRIKLHKEGWMRPSGHLNFNRS